MTRTRCFPASAALLALGCGGAPVPTPTAAPAQPTPPTSIGAPPPAPPPSVARPRADVAAMPEGDRPDLPLAVWLERHEALLNDARANGTRRSQSRLVVLGDSIADGWYASRSFTQQWLKDRPVNLALPGDQTQHLLWRIDQGVLDGLEPRLVVLMVGVFNLIAGFSPEETAAGVQALLSRVRSELPSARVLVVSLLPAGQTSSDPLRARIEATNRALGALAEPNRVVVVDVGGMFIDADGTISPSVMSDFLLPTELGYRALTTALSLVTRQLMVTP